MEIREDEILYLNDDLIELIKTDYSMFQLHLTAQKKEGALYYGSLEFFNMKQLSLPEFVIVEDNLTIERCNIDKDNFPYLIQSESGDIKLENIKNLKDLKGIDFVIKDGELKISHCDSLKSIDCVINANRIIIEYCMTLEHVNYNKLTCNVYILDGPLKNCNGLPEDEYNFNMGD